MVKIKHFNILYKLFITDGETNKNWRRISLGTKAKTKYTTIKQFIYNSTDSHSYGEFIYLLTHNWEQPTCPTCGNKITYKGEYKTYCSRRCARAVQDMNVISESRHKHYLDSKEYDVSIDKDNLYKYDNDYINILIDNHKLSSKYYSLRTSLNKEDANIKYWLNHRIKWSNSWSETLYCVKYNIAEQPKCKICGNPVKFKSFEHGYRKYCTSKCATSDKEIKDIISKKNTTNGVERGRKVSVSKQQRTDEQIRAEISKAKETKLKRYGDENYSNHKQATETNIKRYGCACSLHSVLIKGTYKTTLTDEARKSISIKQKQYWSNKEYRQTIINKLKEGQKNISEDSKQSKLNGYHNWWNNLSDKEKEIHNKNVSTAVTEWSKTLTSEQKQRKKHKEYITKKQNGTFNTSTAEDELAEYIVLLFPDMIRQYKSLKYPYCCDYYIPCIDTYIEFQGSWTHGKHPFGTEDGDEETLNKWKEKNTKYYDNAIQTWTVRDVNKRNTAKKNKLNYIELFGSVNESKQTIYKLYEEQHCNSR